MTKSDITKRLGGYEKAGFVVLTFNHFKAVQTGSKGMPDHLLISYRSGVYFIEVKLGYDKLSEKQKRIGFLLAYLSTRTDWIHYNIVTGEESFEKLIKMIDKNLGV